MTFPLWSVLPFVLMLLSIAVVPLVYPNWWDKNTNKLLLSAAASLPVLAVVLPGASHLLLESLEDYFSFIVLLGALFIISGGIYIKGEFAGTPLVNTGFLAVGAILANLIGTTGASMLLIRPYLRANHARHRKAHLGVFFIFIVSNTAGLLTPLGDPPLFLGFLRGVPFQWTLNLFPIWAFVVGLLLIIFNLYDQYVFVRDDVETPGRSHRRRAIAQTPPHSGRPELLFPVRGHQCRDPERVFRMAARHSGRDHDRDGTAVVVPDPGLGP